MTPTRTLSFVTALAAEPAVVWRRVSTMEGVNDELAPFLRMTAPAHLRGLDLGSAPLGERLFRSWLLLFGVLPVEWDDLTLVAITPGVGFVEESELATQRRWRHERTIAPVAGGCEVRDTLTFAPRIAGTGAIGAAVVGALFRHRHRRLLERFGALPTPAASPPRAPGRR